MENEIRELLIGSFPEVVVLSFNQKLQEGNLTKEEDSENHFTAFFCPYDVKTKKIFIGHHKKSDLWLFNGGHVDKGETLRECVEREIDEEWGLDPKNLKLEKPAYISVTEINNPTKQKCRKHYDVWHFIDVDSNNFKPKPVNLLEEYFLVKWLSLEEARVLVRDRSTNLALDFIETNYFC